MGMSDTRDSINAVRESGDAAREATEPENAIDSDNWDVILAIKDDSADTTTTTKPRDSNKPRPPHPTDSSIPIVGGGARRIRYEPHQFRDSYVDEYTREPLPTHLVKTAIIEELDYFNARVWELTDKKTAMATPDSKLVRTRWVICNTGDTTEYGIRARLVACEIATTTSDDFYASTPPLESKRLLFSEFATARVDSKGVPLELSFVDIRKAYFNAKPTRNVHLMFPREMGLDSSAVAHLKR